MENSQLIQLLAEHQKLLLEQFIATHAQANHQLWEQVTEALPPPLPSSEASVILGRHVMQPASIDLVAGCPVDQWVAVLIPCLIGPVQQDVHTFLEGDLADY